MISEMNLGGHSMGIMLVLGKGEEKVGQRSERFTFGKLQLVCMAFRS